MAEPATLSSSKPSLMMAGKYNAEVEENLGDWTAVDPLLSYGRGRELPSGGIDKLNLVGVLISNLTFLGSPFWNIHPIYCSFLMVEKTEYVVGTFDLNQCLSLPDEIAGTNPELNEPDITRAYLSNVCVAEELHRNGLGYALLEKSKLVAYDWDSPDDLCFYHPTSLDSQMRERYATDREKFAERIANSLLNEAKTRRTKDNTCVIFLDFDTCRVES
ncbi:hypothetical protein HN873_043613 [Arachis hypogaea]